MCRALELAVRARGMTYPNPMVGAVLVKNGRIIGVGYHRKVGGNHAEIEALRAVGTRAKGATLYVTLEPCCHVGRTGPCTAAIIKAGVKRVVCATKDPDPRVNGKGAQELRQAGIEVVSGPGARDARRLNEGYFHHHLTGQPFVILKLAQSLDGRIATFTGDSQWISGKDARAYAHRLRTEVGAVVIGGETARRDDPTLTARLVKGISPYRIVLSRSLDLDKHAHLIAENKDHKTILASTEESIRKFNERLPHAGLIYWAIDLDADGMLSLPDFLAKAGAFGIRSVLVEGGSRLATSFLKQGLMNKFVAVISPKLIGKGIEAIGDLHTNNVDESIQFKDGHFETCGQDMIFSGYPKGPK
ncbi:MAG: bifunctional diaminohydroxyphosphoribosylaminopyrimidine deaminase/5-amino-6-(5-phosphoribosylamino)uracil reductase RibD [candidate division Zixibacteria bacterium]|nr:bifunctional diaminohydroxyphosphoribosylaminopyrimidine deaminase/5-amino-6-(5-phosphoribosylamino)uracil reductase RibD [candidate division Zixibacteria bacterium]